MVHIYSTKCPLFHPDWTCSVLSKIAYLHAHSAVQGVSIAADVYHKKSIVMVKMMYFYNLQRVAGPVEPGPSQVQVVLSQSGLRLTGSHETSPSRENLVLRTRLLSWTVVLHPWTTSSCSWLMHCSRCGLILDQSVINEAIRSRDNILGGDGYILCTWYYVTLMSVVR